MLIWQDVTEHEAIYVGLTPAMARYIILSGIDTTVKTFSSFRQGVQYAFKKEGYSLEKRHT